MVKLKDQLRNFLDDDGKLTKWPADPAFKAIAIKYLASKFELGRNYPEVGINGILNRWHTFMDAALLRRELFERGILIRTPDCRSYWKEAPGLIQDTWSTANLVIRDATETDSDALGAVYDSTSYLIEWEGKDRNPPDYVVRALRKKELPPDGHESRFKFQAVVEKSAGNIVGYLELYHGYPRADVFYLGALRIHKGAQGRGLGREVVEGLLSQARTQNYSEMLLAVSLKNWPGLRFWTQSGFRSITKVVGDKEHRADSFALIELAQSL